MIETIVNEIKTVMVSDLSAKLAAVTTEMGDSLSLPDINALNIYTVEKKFIQNYPAMLIIPISTDIEEQFSEKDLTHEVVVSVAVTGTTEEDTTNRLFRYLEGVKRVLENNRRLNNKAQNIEINRYFYSPTFTDKKGSFLKDFILQIDIQEKENYEP